MMITVKYFGAVADATNVKEEELAIVDGDSVRSIRSKLEEKYPLIKGLSFSLALNQKLTKGDIKIHENDELALLPPFAGG